MDSDNIAIANKPHAVCIPFPAQGHIKPLLNLAKLLHQKGFYITFVNTEYNHNRLLKSRGPNSLDGLPDFRFETIPDGLPPSAYTDVTQHAPSLIESICNNCLDPFRALLHNLNRSASSNVPMVTCIIADIGMQFANQAATDLGIPDIAFAASGACSSLCYFMVCRLVREGLIPTTADLEGLTEEYLDSVLTKSINFKYLPSYYKDPNHKMHNTLLKKMLEDAIDCKSSALVINTFDSFEQDDLNALSTVPPPVYAIGPLHLLKHQIPEDDKLKRIDSNLWVEDSVCIKWLDSKEPNSVLYLNFGSVMVLKPEQLIELAWGLANSKKQFLWIIRRDLVSLDGTILPPEFVSVTKDRGMIASWCPQEQVLKHPSIKGFLCHSGWNSTLESISVGVPMICLSYIADQPINCGLVCHKWGFGMEIDENVERGQVEKVVRDLMEGEKGVEMKAKAMKWKKKAEEACKPGGSTFQNLDKFITQVLRLSDKHTEQIA